jgi:hypothetical protein
MQQTGAICIATQTNYRKFDETSQKQTQTKKKKKKKKKKLNEMKSQKNRAKLNKI